MVRFLHVLSGVCFTFLGLAAFALFILWRNAISLLSVSPAMSLRLLELPLLLSGVLYGGTSLVLSLSRETTHPNRTLATSVFLLLLILFLVILGIDLGFILFI